MKKLTCLQCRHFSSHLKQAFFGSNLYYKVCELTYEKRVCTDDVCKRFKLVPYFYCRTKREFVYASHCKTIYCFCCVLKQNNYLK